MSIAQLKSELADLQLQLETHDIYHNIDNLEKLNTFMEHHIFAVWDFMSLLKSLQSKLTCTTTPWLPPKNRRCAALINRIVVEEESDVDREGVFMSHFDMYHAAMQSLGAQTTLIDFFINDLKAGVPWRISLDNLQVPQAVHQFVEFHLSLTEEADVSTIAAVFAMTREDLVPVMFERFLEGHPELAQQSKSLQYYLERHIELDGGEHGTMAEQMLVDLCGEDPYAWNQATKACQKALTLRIKLWDSVLQHQMGLSSLVGV